MNSENLVAKIQIQEQEVMNSQTAKIMAKAGRQDNYEKVFHLFH